MSNNPFRNRVGSQASPLPSPRPISTNPFLDASEVSNMAVQENTQARSPNSQIPVDKATDGFVSGQQVNNEFDHVLTLHQASMNISDNNELQKTRSRQANEGPRKPDPSSLRGFPRPPTGQRPVTSHRPGNSDEAQQRRAPQAELDIFADNFELKKPIQNSRQPRRNSESSIRDKPAMDPEEEKRRKDRKYRESKRVGTKSGRPNKKLDVIDKLDVTSIYGTGCTRPSMISYVFLLTFDSIPSRWSI